MKRTIVKTDNYLLVVDDSDLKNGEYCIDGYGHLLPFPDLSVLGLGYDKETIKKIIFHLPLNNSPVLEGVPLLPPLEEGVFTFPTHFEFEMDTARIPYDDGWKTIETGIKTTTNSQGQEVACGKYTY